MPVVAVSGFPIEITFQHLLKSLRKILNTTDFWLNELSNSPGTETKHVKVEFNTSYLALTAKNSLDDFLFDYFGDKYPLFAYYNQEDIQTFAPNYRRVLSSPRGGLQQGSDGSGYDRPRDQERRLQKGNVQRGRAQSRPYNHPTGLQRGRDQSIPHYNGSGSRGEPKYDGPRGESRSHFDNNQRGGREPTRSHFDDPRSDLRRPYYEKQRERSPKHDNYKSQSSKLDLEIELLRKQRLVIEEKRKLLMEKQKLEQVRDFRQNDHFYEDDPSREQHMLPERSFKGAGRSFRGDRSSKGGRGNYRQEVSYQPPERSGYPRYKRPEPDSLPRPRYPQEIKTRRIEYNYTHPSQKYPNRSKGSSLPLFITSCNILLEEMKPHIECSSKAEARKLTNQIKITLRNRMAVALEKQENRLSGIEIAKLYRKLYSQSTDKLMIDKTLRQIKEKRQAQPKIEGKSDEQETDDLNTTIDSADIDDEIINSIGNETLDTLDLDSTLNSVDEKIEVDSTTQEDKLEASNFTLEEAILKAADNSLEDAELDNSLGSPEQAKSQARVTGLELEPEDDPEAENILEEAVKVQGIEDKAELNEVAEDV